MRPDEDQVVNGVKPNSLAGGMSELNRVTGQVKLALGKGDILALWDMLQRFMDVSQPIPDMARFEPFRHLDPVTADHDQSTNRYPRYWRDLDLDAWKQNEGAEMARAKAQFPWSQRRCKLTPKLGQIEMSAYREARPETAVTI